MSALPADFAWHQSSVTLMLKCPRQFKLRFVDRIQPDYTAANYAAPLGTADHKGMEHVLERCNDGAEVDRDDLLDAVLEGFEAAIARAQERGATFDPDGLERAHERLEGERLERLLAMAADPRLRAIEWHGIEWQFKFLERSGRLWQGTLDAWGVAIRDVEDFGVLGRDPVVLRRGDGVLADWKTGELPPFGFVARVRHAQLGIYGMALARGVRLGEVVSPPVNRWRTFLAAIQDVERPKAPTDDQGQRIPKWNRKEKEVINPAYLAAHDVSEKAARRMRKKATDAEGKDIPKWLEPEPNPDFERAINSPKGPVFREAVIDYGLVLEDIAQAVRQAELGLFPAAGAVTGQCGMCPYSGVCTASTAPQETPNDDRA